MLSSPVTAEGWFDDLRIEFRIEHSDAAEVQSLLVTLVPDASYEIVGETIVIRGTPEALTQAVELVSELDRPLDRVILDVRVFELSQKLHKYLSRGTKPVYFRNRRSHKPAPNSALGVWVFPHSHSNPALPYQAISGDAKLLFKRRLEFRLGADKELDFPDEVTRGLFSSDTLRMKVAMDWFSETEISTLLTFESANKRWKARTDSPDGETLIIGNSSAGWVIFLTPHLMR